MGETWSHNTPSLFRVTAPPQQQQQHNIVENRWKLRENSSTQSRTLRHRARVLTWFRRNWKNDFQAKVLATFDRLHHGLRGRHIRVWTCLTSMSHRNSFIIDNNFNNINSNIPISSQTSFRDNSNSEEANFDGVQALPGFKIDIIFTHYHCK